jgi:hypothetical protein
MFNCDNVRILLDLRFEFCSPPFHLFSPFPFLFHRHRFVALLDDQDRIHSQAEILAWLSAEIDPMCWLWWRWCLRFGTAFGDL